MYPQYFNSIYYNPYSLYFEVKKEDKILWIVYFFEKVKETGYLNDLIGYSNLFKRTLVQTQEDLEYMCNLIIYHDSAPLNMIFIHTLGEFLFKYKFSKEIFIYLANFKKNTVVEYLIVRILKNLPLFLEDPCFNNFEFFNTIFKNFKQIPLYNLETPNINNIVSVDLVESILENQENIYGLLGPSIVNQIELIKDNKDVYAKQLEKWYPKVLNIAQYGTMHDLIRPFCEIYNLEKTIFSRRNELKSLMFLSLPANNTVIQDNIQEIKDLIRSLVFIPSPKEIGANLRELLYCIKHLPLGDELFNYFYQKTFFQSYLLPNEQGFGEFIISNSKSITQQHIMDLIENMEYMHSKCGDSQTYFSNLKEILINLSTPIPNVVLFIKKCTLASLPFLQEVLIGQLKQNLYQQTTREEMVNLLSTSFPIDIYFPIVVYCREQVLLSPHIIKELRNLKTSLKDIGDSLEVFAPPGQEQNLEVLAGPYLLKMLSDISDAKLISKHPRIRLKLTELIFKDISGNVAFPYEKIGYLIIFTLTSPNQELLVNFFNIVNQMAVYEFKEFLDEHLNMESVIKIKSKFSDPSFTNFFQNKKFIRTLKYLLNPIFLESKFKNLIYDFLFQSAVVSIGFDKKSILTKVLVRLIKNNNESDQYLQEFIEFLINQQKREKLPIDIPHQFLMELATLFPDTLLKTIQKSQIDPNIFFKPQFKYDIQALKIHQLYPLFKIVETKEYEYITNQLILSVILGFVQDFNEVTRSNLQQILNICLVSKRFFYLSCKIISSNTRIHSQYLKDKTGLSKYSILQNGFTKLRSLNGFFPKDFNGSNITDMICYFTGHNQFEAARYPNLKHLNVKKGNVDFNYQELFSKLKTLSCGVYIRPNMEFIKKGKHELEKLKLKGTTFRNTQLDLLEKEGLPRDKIWISQKSTNSIVGEIIHFNEMKNSNVAYIMKNNANFSSLQVLKILPAKTSSINLTDLFIIPSLERLVFQGHSLRVLLLIFQNSFSGVLKANISELELSINLDSFQLDQNLVKLQKIFEILNRVKTLTTIRIHLFNSNINFLEMAPWFNLYKFKYQYSNSCFKSIKM